MPCSRLFSRLVPRPCTTTHSNRHHTQAHLLAVSLSENNFLLRPYVSYIESSKLTSFNLIQTAGFHPPHKLLVEEWETVLPDLDNRATTKDLFSYALCFLM